MRWKRFVSLGLTGILTAGVFAGCGQEEESQKESKPKGSYVEEEMEIPWSQEESYGTCFLNQDKQLEILTSQGTGSATKVYSYTNTGGEEWDKQEESWAQGLVQDGEYLSGIRKGQDENYYLMVQAEVQEEDSEDSNYMTEDGELFLPATPTKLYRYTEKGELSQLPIEVLDTEYQQENGGVFLYYWDVNQAGDIAFVNVDSDNIVLYDSTTGKEKQSFKNHPVVQMNDKMTAMSGNTLITLNAEQKGLTLYDTQTGHETGTVALGENENSAGGGICQTGEDTYAFLNWEGIFLYKKDGTLGEQIFDGTRGVMGGMENTLSLMDFIPGDKEDYYSVYMDYQTGAYTLCYYSYNAAVNAETEEELDVCSLYENKLVKDAVRKFQQKNPQVQVNYEYYIKDGAEGEPDDYIDTLNTELLNKEGADVLILDDLPVESYIEKGILEELTDFSGELINQGLLLENIAQGVEQEGKTYEVPASFNLPLYYGIQEALKPLESMEALESYLQANPQGKLLGAAAYQQIAYLLFASNYQEIQTEEGGVSADKIARLLELSKQVYDNNPSEDMQQVWTTNANGVIKTNKMTPFSQIGMMELYEDSSIAGVENINGLASTALMYDILKQNSNMTAKTVHGYFMPASRLGINSSSEKKELAKEFIQTALDGEIQKNDYSEGLPVNPESLEMQKEIAAQGQNEAMFGVSTENGVEHTYGYPAQEQLEQLIELAKSADTSLVLNLTVKQAFLDAADKYYGGDVSAEEAAEEMAKEMSLYLSE